jgi:hypothetical protein
MNGRRAVAFAASSAAIAVGCTTILNLDEATPYAPPDAFASLANPYPGNPEAGPLPEAAAPDGSACGADLQNDASNCGRCGRVCGDQSACAGGRCAPIALVTGLTAPPNKILIGAKGHGFFSLAQPVYLYRAGTPATACYTHKIYSFDLSASSAPVLVGTPCGRYADYSFWGIDDADRVYGWFQDQVSPYNTQPGSLLRFGPDPAPDGGTFDAGTLVAKTTQYNTVIPDPNRPGSILYGTVPSQAASVSLNALLDDGGSEAVLTVTPPAGATVELLSAFDVTDAGFAVYSRTPATTGERIWLTPRPYTGGAGAVTTAPTYASLCGVRRFDRKVRWCGTQLDVSETAYELLLFELDADTGAVRLVNAAPVIPRSTNGSPILPVFLLDESGVYYTRGPKIDLLPLSGAPQTITLAISKPSALYGDAQRIYWAEADGIYGAAK